ncbi:hypothetical protein [Polaromonas sp.]|uniref:hypothetical protein n=1 Tax=Polaromonas sp. TaxID=1869339 RepID=UPI003BB695DA
MNRAIASPKPAAPCSVFDLANSPIRLRAKFNSATRPLNRIERTGSITRCIRILPQDTAEWKDRETARRARQTPPRPGAKVKASMNAMKA